MKIAVVEDSIDSLYILQKSLPTDEITHFSEVSQFKDGPYATVLTDLRLLETSGFDTIIELRKKTAVPIIVMSDMACEDEDRDAMVKVGATFVVPKSKINDKLHDLLCDLLQFGNTDPAKQLPHEP